MPEDEAKAVEPSEAAMVKAAAEGAIDDMKRMLDKGREANKAFILRDPVNTSKDPTTGYLPLMIAAVNGRAFMCHLLIKMKAGLDCVDERGDSPLHRAAVQSDRDVIEALILGGMPPDVRAKSGLMPLHCAAIRGNTDVSEKLLEMRASPNVHDSAFGSTPLHFAAMEVRLRSSLPAAPH